MHDISTRDGMMVMHSGANAQLLWIAMTASSMLHTVVCLLFRASRFFLASADRVKH